jgi:DNA primase
MHLIRISRERIDAIKARIDFAALLAERGIELEPRGRHLFGLCPFHAERNPSFVVTPHLGLFHCFGCGVGGDVIGFVVNYDHVSFPDAVRMLAARAGVALDPEPHGGRPDDEESLLRRMADARGEAICGRTSWR